MKNKSINYEAVLALVVKNFFGNVPVLDHEWLSTCV